MAYINDSRILSVKFIGGTGITDQDYNPESENAQSGKAVAQAVAEAQLGGASIDNIMSDTSENPVQNKVVKKYVDETSEGMAEGVLENHILNNLSPDMSENITIGMVPSGTAVVNYVASQMNDVETVKKQGEKGGTIDILPELESENKLEFKVITVIQNGTVKYNFLDSYKTTPIIELKKGQSIRFYAEGCKFRKLVEFTANDVNTGIEGSIKENFSDFTIKATDGNKYVQVSFPVDSYTRNIYVETRPNIEIEYGVSLNNEQIAQVKKELIGECEYKNMLTGKRWVACGDSLTEGSEEYGTFADGLYKGENMVYPFFVGRRCGVDVVNEAKKGSTLANCPNRTENGQPRVDHFSNTRYQSTEFADADYITIKIGTNDDDNHQKVPIGTIDDTENTTFYGAWNVVLSYLTQTYPKAHIGIIVSNVATLPYVEATIAAATKWGVPYLNMATDPQLPLAYRSIRTDVQDSVKNARNAAFKVNIENDSHPNADWHEFESRLIESWLMTI